ncbi:hypothetical protein [Kitasatospora cineracea]|uniref:hypothetical protein n=1 Tax=Kitasatospora cineracea TaxID=88074 RepID=UPI0013C36FD8|nr:hypothetical protein [Kitasatospora cineracea]
MTSFTANSPTSTTVPAATIVGAVGITATTTDKSALGATIVCTVAVGPIRIG